MTLNINVENVIIKENHLYNKSLQNKTYLGGKGKLNFMVVRCQVSVCDRYRHDPIGCRDEFSPPTITLPLSQTVAQ